MSKHATFCGLLALACSAAWAGGRDKLSHELASVDSNSEAKVIIQWKTAPDDTKHQRVKNHGGQLHSTLKSIKAGVYSVPGSSLNALSNDPDVLYISADRPLRGTLDNSVAAVRASAAWAAGWNGRGIGIAVIDSGITTSGDLDTNGSLGPGPRVVYNEDFVNPKGDGKDQYGHGTHVAGILAATGKSTNCSHCARKFVASRRARG
jgi:serine protease AprX